MEWTTLLKKQGQGRTEELKTTTLDELLKDLESPETKQETQLRLLSSPDFPASALLLPLDLLEMNAVEPAVAQWIPEDLAISTDTLEPYELGPVSSPWLIHSPSCLPFEDALFDAMIQKDPLLAEDPSMQTIPDVTTPDLDPAILRNADVPSPRMENLLSSEELVSFQMQPHGNDLAHLHVPYPMPPQMQSVYGHSGTSEPAPFFPQPPFKASVKAAMLDLSVPQPQLGQPKPKEDTDGRSGSELQLPPTPIQPPSLGADLQGAGTFQDLSGPPLHLHAPSFPQCAPAYPKACPPQSSFDPQPVQLLRPQYHSLAPPLDVNCMPSSHQLASLSLPPCLTSNYPPYSFNPACNAVDNWPPPLGPQLNWNPKAVLVSHWNPYCPFPSCYELPFFISPLLQTGISNQLAHSHNRSPSWVSGLERPLVVQSSHDGNSLPQNLEANYELWKTYCKVAKSVYTSSPDAEALACFLIPAIRSVTFQHPEIPFHEAVKRAVSEWEKLSNFDRMEYYHTARKFMEVKEEELKLQAAAEKATAIQEAANHKQIPTVTDEDSGRSTGSTPKKGGAGGRTRRAKGASRTSRGGQALRGDVQELAGEALREYTEIMEALEALDKAGSEDAREEVEGHGGVEEEGSFVEYLNELCRQEEFVSEVGAEIDLAYISSLLSSDSNPTDLLIQPDVRDKTWDVASDVPVAPAACHSHWLTADSGFLLHPQPTSQPTDVQKAESNSDVATASSLLETFTVVNEMKTTGDHDNGNKTGAPGIPDNDILADLAFFFEMDDDLSKMGSSGHLLREGNTVGSVDCEAGYVHEATSSSTTSCSGLDPARTPFSPLTAITTLKERETPKENTETWLGLAQVFQEAHQTDERSHLPQQDGVPVADSRTQVRDHQWFSLVSARESSPGTPNEPTKRDPETGDPIVRSHHDMEASTMRLDSTSDKADPKLATHLKDAAVEILLEHVGGGSETECSPEDAVPSGTVEDARRKEPAEIEAEVTDEIGPQMDSEGTLTGEDVDGEDVEEVSDLEMGIKGGTPVTETTVEDGNASPGEKTTAENTSCMSEASSSGQDLKTGAVPHNRDKGYALKKRGTRGTQGAKDGSRTSYGGSDVQDLTEVALREYREIMEALDALNKGYSGDTKEEEGSSVESESEVGTEVDLAYGSSQLTSNSNATDLLRQPEEQNNTRDLPTGVSAGAATCHLHWQTTDPARSLSPYTTISTLKERAPPKENQETYPGVDLVVQEASQTDGRSTIPQQKGVVTDCRTQVRDPLCFNLDSGSGSSPNIVRQDPVTDSTMRSHPVEPTASDADTPSEALTGKLDKTSDEADASIEMPLEHADGGTRTECSLEDAVPSTVEDTRRKEPTEDAAEVTDRVDHQMDREGRLTVEDNREEVSDLENGRKGGIRQRPCAASPGYLPVQNEGQAAEETPIRTETPATETTVEDGNTSPGEKTTAENTSCLSEASSSGQDLKTGAVPHKRDTDSTMRSTGLVAEKDGIMKDGTRDRNKGRNPKTQSKDGGQGEIMTRSKTKACTKETVGRSNRKMSLRKGVGGSCHQAIHSVQTKPQLTTGSGPVITERGQRTEGDDGAPTKDTIQRATQKATVGRDVESSSRRSEAPSESENEAAKEKEPSDLQRTTSRRTVGMVKCLGRERTGTVDGQILKTDVPQEVKEVTGRTRRCKVETTPGEKQDSKLHEVQIPGRTGRRGQQEPERTSKPDHCTVMEPRRNRYSRRSKKAAGTPYVETKKPRAGHPTARSEAPSESENKAAKEKEPSDLQRTTSRRKAGMVKCLGRERTGMVDGQILKTDMPQEVKEVQIPGRTGRRGQQEPERTSKPDHCIVMETRRNRYSRRSKEAAGTPYVETKKPRAGHPTAATKPAAAEETANQAPNRRNPGSGKQTGRRRTGSTDAALVEDDRSRQSNPVDVPRRACGANDGNTVAEVPAHERTRQGKGSTRSPRLSMSRRSCGALAAPEGDLSSGASERKDFDRYGRRLRSAPALSVSSTVQNKSKEPTENKKRDGRRCARDGTQNQASDRSPRERTQTRSCTASQQLQTEKRGGEGKAKDNGTGKSSADEKRRRGVGQSAEERQTNRQSFVREGPKDETKTDARGRRITRRSGSPRTLAERERRQQGMATRSKRRMQGEMETQGRTIRRQRATGTTRELDYRQSRMQCRGPQSRAQSSSVRELSEPLAPTTPQTREENPTTANRTRSTLSSESCSVRNQKPPGKLRPGPKSSSDPFKFQRQQSRKGRSAGVSQVRLRPLGESKRKWRGRRRGIGKTDR